MKRFLLIYAILFVFSIGLTGCNEKNADTPEDLAAAEEGADGEEGTDGAETAPVVNDPIIDLLINGESVPDSQATATSNPDTGSAGGDYAEVDSANVDPSIGEPSGNDLPGNTAVPVQNDAPSSGASVPKVNINTIEDTYGSDYVAAPASTYNESMEPYSTAYIPPEENRYSTEKEDHEVTPQFFDVGPCYVDVIGSYSSKDAVAIIDQINGERQTYKIPKLTLNASLCKVADVRAKELTYNWGHIRPDYSNWNTVAPEYFQAEIIAICTEEEGVKKGTQEYFNATASRMKALDEDFTNVGASVFTTDGRMYIAVAFGY